MNPCFLIIVMLSGIFFTGFKYKKHQRKHKRTDVIQTNSNVEQTQAEVRKVIQEDSDRQLPFETKKEALIQEGTIKAKTLEVDTIIAKNIILPGATVYSEQKKEKTAPHDSAHKTTREESPTTKESDIINTPTAIKPLKIFNPETLAEFENYIKEPCVVYIDADWCTACDITDSIFYNVAREWGHKLTFLRIDADKFRDLATDRLHIKAIPIFLFFNNGKEVAHVNRLTSSKTTYSQLTDSIKSAFFTPHKP